jgi:hypothetical protein
MRITISMPDEVYDKLEEDRGSIPRSTYIQELIKGGKELSTKGDKPKKVSKAEETKEFVRTKGKEKWVQSEEVTLEGLQGEVEEAIEVGEKENWERVKGLLSKAGYEWDSRQWAILKEGRIAYRPSNR